MANIIPEEVALRETEEKLKTYRTQLEEVSQLLLVDQSDVALGLEAQIKGAIATCEQQMVQQKEALDAKLSVSFVVGALCEAKYDDGNWYTVRIDSSSEEDGEKRFVVSFIGYDNVVECAAEKLRVYKPPTKDQLKPGIEIMAVWAEDSKMYEATLDKVTSNGNSVWVTYSGWRTAAEVPLTHIQLSKVRPPKAKPIPLAKQKNNPKAKTLLDRERKKKKLEKWQERKAAAVEEGERSKQQWQKFSGKMANRGPSKLRTVFNPLKGESKFRTPEENPDAKVGVMTSGKGMTKQNSFNPVKKR